ncbi:ATP-binding cassette domain-containing protein [Streptococcus iniae]|uniref:ATP-binding cassette domain-containing protein n=1 Tax=Streptococcus iniae TaxID=1346 RepID=UPI00345F6231
MQLQEKRNTQISDLSQGMTKKLSMVNIFINDYDLIILDEPFNRILSIILCKHKSRVFEY